MLTNHRTVIRELLQFILDSGVTELSHLQYIHVGNRYPDTIVGIGAGMALSKLNREKPILIMVEQPEDPSLCGSPEWRIFEQRRQGSSFGTAAR